MERREETSKWRGNHIKSESMATVSFIIDLPAMREYDYRLTGSHLSSLIGEKVPKQYMQPMPSTLAPERIFKHAYCNKYCSIHVSASLISGIITSITIISSSF